MSVKRRGKSSPESTLRFPMTLESKYGNAMRRVLMRYFHNNTKGYYCKCEYYLTIYSINNKYYELNAKKKWSYCSIFY